MTIIKMPHITFSAGDARPSLLAALKKHSLRPLYGPEDATGRRPLVGAIAADQVELFAELMAIADAQTPDEGQG